MKPLFSYGHTPESLAFQTADIAFDRGVAGATILVRPVEQPTRVAPADLTWTVREAPDQAGITLQTVYHNHSDQPVRLRDFTLATGILTCDGNPAAWKLATLGAADHATDLNLSTGNRTFTDYLTIYTDHGRRGLLLSAVGTDHGPQADVTFDCQFRHPGRFTLTIRCEMSDVLVPPGESRESEEVLILAGAWTTTTRTAMEWIARTHGARTQRGPVFGWCSWYHKRHEVAARDVIRLAETIQQHRDRLPLQVIQIDDGFQRAYGDWRLNDKFPDGWSPVINAIRAAGAQPGIWLAPTLVKAGVKVDPAWFQRDAAGTISDHLDPTHPGAERFIRQLIRDHRAAGFEYFKFDFTTILKTTRFHDPTRTRFQVFRDLYQLYREEIGNDTYLLACTTSLARGVAGLADACRIGVDSMAIWTETHGICISRAIQATGATAAANGILFANDPDVTYTWPHRLTEHEWQTWHSFVGLLGGTAMVSEPFHVGEQLLGHVECQIHGDMLTVHASINDIAIATNTTKPWEASCVEVFGSPVESAQVGQVFLTPTGALRSQKGSVVPAPTIKLTHLPRPGGYELTATIPLVKFSVRPNSLALRLEVRVFSTVNPDYGLAAATLCGSNMPYQTTARYGELRRGKTISGELKVGSIVATMRRLEILQPPHPARAISHAGGTDSWHRQFGYPVKRPWGYAANVLLWNSREQAVEVPLDLSVFGGIHERYYLWSFWDERCLGALRPLPAHGCLLLRVTAAKRGPVIVGSTLHSSMGAAEIRDVQVTRETLTIQLTDAGARAGKIFLMSQRKLALANATGLTVSSVARTGRTWVITIADRQRGQPQTITLQFASKPKPASIAT